MGRKSLIILVLLLLLQSFTGSIVLAATQQAISAETVDNAGAPAISAPSAIVMDADGGQVLFAKNNSNLLPISAVCKLMTVLIASESGDMTASVTISSDSVEAEGSALNIEAGSKYTLQELLYGIMLSSANDAATAVAEYIAGDTAKFVDQMNRTAEKLDMKNTHFTNPTGLFDANQQTTAEDMAKLLQYAIRNPEFSRIFTSKARPWYTADNATQILTSPNKLFWSYSGIEGGKTGYTDKTRQTIAVTAVRDGLHLICIVLDSPEGDLFGSAASLMDYSFGRYRRSILVNAGDIVKAADYNGSRINLISTQDIYYVHPLGEDYISEFSAVVDLKEPIRKSVPGGSAKYILKDGTEINLTLYPESEVLPPDTFWVAARKKLQDNRDILILVIFLTALEIILVLFTLVRLLIRFAHWAKKRLSR